MINKSINSRCMARTDRESGYLQQIDELLSRYPTDKQFDFDKHGEIFLSKIPNIN